ncbi:hypothetical protein CYMTET_41619 [Cymbomonas tetramitiformis]|uniref:RCC1-like domain-containing protein n=1 Tax=Cymbomonas tetramitiformis TaxID=36881 RepID=A0AAE0C5Q2_9CHLO|nr:hypothetical protein CYMTET_41619 [Cymbomonas tetramitiformis]
MLTFVIALTILRHLQPGMAQSTMPDFSWSTLEDTSTGSETFAGTTRIDTRTSSAAGGRLAPAHPSEMPKSRTQQGVDGQTASTEERSTILPRGSEDSGAPRAQQAEVGTVLASTTADHATTPLTQGNDKDHRTQKHLQTLHQGRHSPEERPAKDLDAQPGDENLALSSLSTALPAARNKGFDGSVPAVGEKGFDSRRAAAARKTIRDLAWDTARWAESAVGQVLQLTDAHASPGATRDEAHDEADGMVYEPAAGNGGSGILLAERVLSLAESVVDRLTGAVAVATGHTAVADGEHRRRLDQDPQDDQQDEWSEPASNTAVQVPRQAIRKGVTTILPRSSTATPSTGGQVYATGYNGHGELGDGTTTQRYSPVRVMAGHDVVHAAAGSHHTAFVTSGGEVYATGYNGHGQLGDGTRTYRYSPVRVMAGHDVVHAAGGSGHHTAFVTSGGEVYTTGRNYYGELGDGTTTNRYSPVRVMAGHDVVHAAGGRIHTAFVTSGGQVYTTGYNNHGQLGDGTTTHRYSPVRVMAGHDVVHAAAGSYHTAFVTSGGEVYTTGRNYNGELGDGTTTNRYSPVRVMAGHDVVHAAGGEYHTAFVTSGGEVYATGYNGYGQLGDGTRTHRYSPVRVMAGHDVVHAAAGEHHTAFVTSGGEVYATGYNLYGQLALLRRLDRSEAGDQRSSAADRSVTSAPPPPGPSETGDQRSSAAWTALRPVGRGITAGQQVGAVLPGNRWGRGITGGQQVGARYCRGQQVGRGITLGGQGAAIPASRWGAVLPAGSRWGAAGGQQVGRCSITGGQQVGRGVAGGQQVGRGIAGGSRWARYAGGQQVGRAAGGQQVGARWPPAGSRARCRAGSRWGGIAGRAADPSARLEEESTVDPALLTEAHVPDDATLSPSSAPPSLSKADSAYYGLDVFYGADAFYGLGVGDSAPLSSVQHPAHLTLHVPGAPPSVSELARGAGLGATSAAAAASATKVRRLREGSTGVGAGGSAGLPSSAPAQLFTAAAPFDLARAAVVFEPLGPEAYRACLEHRSPSAAGEPPARGWEGESPSASPGATRVAFDAAGGWEAAVIPLGSAAFPFFNESYNAVRVEAAGRLTFGDGQRTERSEGFEAHFATPGISALLGSALAGPADPAGTTVWYEEVSSGTKDARLVVTWQLPAGKLDSGGTATTQAALHLATGSIRLSWGDVDTATAEGSVVGLSPGTAPAQFQGVKMSGVGFCAATPKGALMDSGDAEGADVPDEGTASKDAAMALVTPVTGRDTPGGMSLSRERRRDRTRGTRRASARERKQAAAAAAMAKAERSAFKELFGGLGGAGRSFPSAASSSAPSPADGGRVLLPSAVHDRTRRLIVRAERLAEDMEAAVDGPSRATVEDLAGQGSLYRGGSGGTVSHATGENSSVLYYPFGIQREVPEAVVRAGGWKVCYDGSKASAAVGGQYYFASCQGEHILLAVRARRGEALGTLQLLAAGRRADVLRETHSDEAAEAHNGAFWYNLRGRSVGVAGASDVSLRPMDLRHGYTRCEDRLSWRATMLAGAEAGGRAGCEMWSGAEGEWRKVAYHRAGGVHLPDAGEAGWPSGKGGPAAGLEILSRMSSTSASSGSSLQLFAVTDAAHCAESLPYGPSAVTESSSAYLSTRLRDVAHTTWTQRLQPHGSASGELVIGWSFASARTLQDRFYYAWLSGEPVTWTITYNGATFVRTSSAGLYRSLRNYMYIGCPDGTTCLFPSETNTSNATVPSPPPLPVMDFYGFYGFYGLEPDAADTDDGTEDALGAVHPELSRRVGARRASPPPPPIPQTLSTSECLDLRDLRQPALSRMQSTPTQTFSYDEREGVKAFDLSHTTLLLSPEAVDGDAAGGYRMCLQRQNGRCKGMWDSPSSDAVSLSLPDDGHRMVDINRQFRFFGETYTQVYVGSNGELAFGQPHETLEAGTPSERLVVTWEAVPEHFDTGANHFQAALYPATGAIRLSWAEISATRAVVGLSPGGGAPASFSEANLSADASTCVGAVRANEAAAAAAGLMYADHVLRRFTGDEADAVALPAEGVAVAGNSARSILLQLRTTMQEDYCVVSTGSPAENRSFSVTSYGSQGRCVGVMGYLNDFHPGYRGYPAHCTPVNDGAWHHVAVTYDGEGILRVYVDGAEDNRAEGRAYDTAGQENFLGRSHDEHYPDLLVGEVHGVAFFDRALSGDEIAAAATATNSSAALEVLARPAAGRPGGNVPYAEGHEWYGLHDIAGVEASRASTEVGAPPSSAAEDFVSFEEIFHVADSIFYGLSDDSVPRNPRRPSVPMPPTSSPPPPHLLWDEHPEAPSWWYEQGLPRPPVPAPARVEVLPEGSLPTVTLRPGESYRQELELVNLGDRAVDFTIQAEYWTLLLDQAVASGSRGSAALTPLAPGHFRQVAAVWRGGWWGCDDARACGWPRSPEWPWQTCKRNCDGVERPFSFELLHNGVHVLEQPAWGTLPLQCAPPTIGHPVGARQPMIRQLQVTLMRLIAATGPSC